MGIDSAEGVSKLFVHEVWKGGEGWWLTKA